MEQTQAILSQRCNGKRSYNTKTWGLQSIENIRRTHSTDGINKKEAHFLKQEAMEWKIKIAQTN